MPREQRRLLAFLGVWTGALLLVTGCESTVDDSLEGMPCDAQGNCVTGYFCDAHQLCVRHGSAESFAGAAAADGSAGEGPASSEPPAAKLCASGQCLGACPVGKVDCAGACVDLGTDPANCGACARACKAPAHGIPICKAVCSFACEAGFQLCGNGCIDTTRDKKHCGSCDNACDKGDCVAGVCDDEGDKSGPG